MPEESKVLVKTPASLQKPRPTAFRPGDVIRIASSPWRVRKVTRKDLVLSPLYERGSVKLDDLLQIEQWRYHVRKVTPKDIYLRLLAFGEQ